MEINAIPRRLAFTAGGQQLINWGISFYMPGTFAGAIAADKGWSLPQIYLGLTLAMLMMAAVSPFVARLLARFGGRLVVTSGTLLIAASCAMMAWRPSLAGWYGAWLLTGIGMRLSLYDALFAAVVNLYGQQARKTISHITLAGGLASALFWPLGEALLTIMPWQNALRIYALFGLLSAWLSYQLPRQRLNSAAKSPASPATAEGDRRNGARYAIFIALITFISNGTSTICRSLSALWSAGCRRYAVGIRPDRRPAGGSAGRSPGHLTHANAFYCARHAALFSPWIEQHDLCRMRSRVCAGLWRD